VRAVRVRRHGQERRGVAAAARARARERCERSRAERRRTMRRGRPLSSSILHLRRRQPGAQ
jgi:hypothetical protein